MAGRRTAGRPGLSGTKTISAQAGAGTGLSLAIVYGSEVQKDCLFVELSVLVRARRPKLKANKRFLIGLGKYLGHCGIFCWI